MQWISLYAILFYSILSYSVARKPRILCHFIALWRVNIADIPEFTKFIFEIKIFWILDSIKTSVQNPPPFLTFAHNNPTSDIYSILTAEILLHYRSSNCKLKFRCRSKSFAIRISMQNPGNPSRRRTYSTLRMPKFVWKCMRRQLHRNSSRAIETMV